MSEKYKPAEPMPGRDILESIVNRPKRNKYERRGKVRKGFEDYSVQKINGYLTLIKNYHVPKIIDWLKPKSRKNNKLHMAMKVVEGRMLIAKNKLAEYLANKGHEIKIMREIRYHNCPANLEDLLFNKMGIAINQDEDLARKYFDSCNHKAKCLKPEPERDELSY